ncbi:Serine/threonine-protein kinase PrkC [Planctomycetales bacterium 10988]|nr:Serine/threonine-protein kinase PrkC [Planctomycetales bacterium 10988]
MTKTASPQVVSGKQYHELLLRSGLISRTDLSQVLRSLSHKKREIVLDGRVLGQHLVELGKLTPWQNWHLLRGRSKGFFIGHYKMLEHVATGGMSTVYLAEHMILERRVALKVMDPRRLQDGSFLKRFYQEMKTLAKLDHPNIIRVFDCGVSKARFHYVVLEFIDGPELQKQVEQDGPLSYTLAANYLRQAAVGLDEIHRTGMVHRDIKPSNLLVDPKGILKILDMGLVRVLNHEDRSITLAHEDSLLGTLDYLAPEQAIDSHNVDHRADIYALGCTLYFMLTGEAPFGRGTVAQILMRHQSQAPESILTYRPDAPQELVNLCREMMAKRPEDRVQTMLEVIEAIDHWFVAEQSAKSEAALLQTSLTAEEASRAASEEDLIEMFDDVDPNTNPLAHALLASSQQDSRKFHLSNIWKIVPASIEALRWGSRPRRSSESAGTHPQ